MVAVPTSASNAQPAAKPMRFKKFLQIFGIVQLVLLALLAWLLFTTSGLRAALSLRPAELQFSAAQGTLWGGFALDSARFSQDGLTISADRIAATPIWPELLSKRLRLKTLDVRALSIVQSPLQQPPPPESTMPSAWALAVDQLSVDGLRFGQKSDAKSEGVTLISLNTISGKALELADQQLMMTSLSVQERRASLQMSGTLNLRSLPAAEDKTANSTANSLNVTLTTSPQFDEILAWPAPIVFDATLSGDRQALKLALRASPPFDLILQADIADPLGKLSWNASVKSQATAIGVIAKSPQFEALKTDLSGSGDLRSASLSGQFALDGAPFELESLSARVSEDFATLSFDALKIILPNQGWLSAVGTWPLQPSAAPGALTLAWQDFALPAKFSWPQDLASSAGSAALSGYFDALGVAAELKLARSAASDIAAVSELAGDLSLQMQISPALIELQKLAFELVPSKSSASSGKASISGQLQRELGALKSVKLDVQAADFNPALFIPEFPGLLALDAALDLRFAATDGNAALKPTGTLQIKNLSGVLRERPLAGQGELRFASSLQPAGTLDLRWGNNQVTLRPQLNSDLQASLDLQELALFDARAKGSIQGDLMLIADATGTLVGIDGALSARLLSLAELTVRELELKLQAPSGQSAPIVLALDASGVAYGEQRVELAKLNVLGTRAQHTLTAELQSSQGDISLSAAGAHTPRKIAASSGSDALPSNWGQWQGLVNKLSLQPAIKPAQQDASAAAERQMEINPPARRAQIFTLKAPSLILISSAITEIAESCFDSDAGLAFCLSARWPSKGAGRATLSLNRVPIAALWDALSAAPSAAMSGALSGLVEIQAQDGQAQQLNANIAQLEPVVFALSPEVVGDALDSKKSLSIKTLALDLRAQMQAGVWRPVLNGTLEMEEGLSLRMQSLALAADDALSGSVEFDLADLAKFSDMSNAVGKMTGRVQGAFALAGTLQTPLLSGDLRGSALSAEIPAAGITLKDGTLSVNAMQDRFVLEGSLKSGEGVLTFSGAYAPKLDKGRLSLEINGERVLLTDIPSARVIANPELKLTHDGKLIRITGKMTVPEANIQLDRFESSVTRSNDVVIIDAAPVPEGVPIRADVAIVLGDNVLLKGFGLDGKLAGSLKIRERPNRPSTGRGEIQVTGTYKAYGQDLLIERGRLLFAASPLDDPGLDIRAVRKIDKIKAGVQVRGTAAQPALTVWSNPIMEQSEVLSYIVLGRGLKGASGADSALVNQAANALGTAGGNLLAKGIGQRIGLELGVETLSEIGGPAFTAGRYLSPRLYIGYGQGLFNPQTLFILRYKWFDSYEIEALSGNEQKVGVNYRKER